MSFMKKTTRIEKPANFSRRALLKAGGALVVSIGAPVTFDFARADDAAGAAAMSVSVKPALTPDQLRGRVASVSSLFVSFSNELGAFESGAVAGLFGPVFAVVSGGVGTIVVVTLVALRWSALLRMPPLHALRPEGFAPHPVREVKPEPVGASTARA